MLTDKASDRSLSSFDFQLKILLLSEIFDKVFLKAKEWTKTSKPGFEGNQ